MKSNKGITLIALVVTIIVLLILSMIAIPTFLGSNGLMNKSADAVEKNKIGEITDKVQIEILASIENDGELNMLRLKENLKKNLGVKDIEDTEDGGIIFSLEGYQTSVDGKGRITIEKGTISEKQYLYDAITEKNYGEFVNYNVDINDNAKFDDDWKVFFKDSEYVYLIASEFVPIKKLPTTNGMSTRNTYGLFWSSLPNTSSDNLISAITDSYIKTKYFTKFNVNSTNDNARSTATLLNPSNWTAFKGEYGEEAIGGATLELWIACWNQRHTDEQFSCYASNYGIYVGANDNNPTNINSTNTTINIKNDDSLLIPTKGWYWLASPFHTTGTDNQGKWTALAGSGKYFTCATPTTLNEYGVRPVIRLQKKIIAEKTDNVWQLSK